MKNIESDIDPINDFYPVNEYDNFNKWSVGYNLSSA